MKLQAYLKRYAFFHVFYCVLPFFCGILDRMENWASMPIDKRRKLQSSLEVL